MPFVELHVCAYVAAIYNFSDKEGQAYSQSNAFVKVIRFRSNLLGIYEAKECLRRAGLVGDPGEKLANTSRGRGLSQWTRWCYFNGKSAEASHRISRSADAVRKMQSVGCRNGEGHQAVFPARRPSLPNH